MVELKRSLGFFSLLALSLATMISTQMFFGSSIGAKYAGVASIISFIILSLISIYIASCFGELASMFPKAGGTYEYSKQTYNRFIAFLMGWVSWIINNMATTLLIVAAIDYLTPELVPMWFKLLIVFSFIILLNLVVYIGVDAGAMLAKAFLIITGLFLLSFIIFGISHINESNYSPFFSKPTIGIYIAIFFLIEAFFGWEGITFLSEEAINPEKLIPKVLIISTVIAAIINLILVIIMFGIIPSSILETYSAPMSAISSLVFGIYGKYIVGIGIYLIMIGAAFAAFMELPRLLLAMSRDKLFLNQFTKIHPKYKTPYRAIIFQCVISILIVLIGLGRYEMLLELVLPLAIFMYIIVLISIPILRIKKPDIHREFKVYFGKIGPIFVSLFFLVILYLWISLNETAIRSIFFGISFVLISIPIYFLLQMYYNPKFIIFVNDFFSYVALYTEKIFLPKNIKNILFDLMGTIKGKVILEYGSNVGTFTVELAKRIGKKGKIYATDTSIHNLGIVEKRLNKNNNVITLLNKPNKLSSKVPDVDIVVSVATISYLQQVENVLLELNSRLDVGDKVLFMDYDNFFYFIPNVPFLNSDEKIILSFKKCGYLVKVKRKQGLFWRYLFIYGKKIKNI